MSDHGDNPPADHGVKIVGVALDSFSIEPPDHLEGGPQCISRVLIRTSDGPDDDDDHQVLTVRIDHDDTISLAEMRRRIFDKALVMHAAMARLTTQRLESFNQVWLSGHSTADWAARDLDDGRDIFKEQDD